MGPVESIEEARQAHPSIVAARRIRTAANACCRNRPSLRARRIHCRICTTFALGTATVVEGRYARGSTLGALPSRELASHTRELRCGVPPSGEERAPPQGDELGARRGVSTGSRERARVRHQLQICRRGEDLGGAARGGARGRRRHCGLELGRQEGVGGRCVNA